jgi:hypothetical protein
LRKQKLPNVLPLAETELLRKINQALPVEIQKRYNYLIKRRKNETLNVDEQQELVELTASSENQNVLRLNHLIELAKIRNVSFDELIQLWG